MKKHTKRYQRLIHSIVQDRKNGAHINDICEKYCLSNVTVYRWLKLYDEDVKTRLAESQRQQLHLSAEFKNKLVSYMSMQSNISALLSQITNSTFPVEPEFLINCASVANKRNQEIVDLVLKRIDA